jgi:hypothetical protein
MSRQARKPSSRFGTCFRCIFGAKEKLSSKAWLMRDGIPKVAENLSGERGLTGLTYRKYLFVGFNALSNAKISCSSF